MLRIKDFLTGKLLLTNQHFPRTDYIRLPLAFLVHKWCSCQRSFSTVLCHMWHSPQFYFQAGLFSKTLFFFKVRFLSVVPHWYCWIVSRPSKITYVLPPKPHASFKVWTLCCLWDSWIRTAFLVSRLRVFCQTSNCCASFQSLCEELWTRVLCGRKYPSLQHQYHQPSSNSSAIKLWEDESSRRWEESIIPEISLK